MKNRFVIAVFMAFFPLIAHAEPSPPTSSLSIGAEQFVNQFWGQWSSQNSVALPYIQSVINDPVTFLGTTMSAREYMAVQTKFAGRWPQRIYAPQPNSEHVSCDQKQSTCRVDGIVNWQAWQLGKFSTGTANFTFILTVRMQKSAASYHVSAMSSTVISRAVTKAAGPTITLTQNEADDLRAQLGTTSDQNEYGQFDPSDDAAVQKLGCAADDNGTIIHQGCALVTAFDLTSAFHTRNTWSFLVLQGPPVANEWTTGNSGPGFFSFCFLKDTIFTCQHSGQISTYPPMDFDQNTFISASIVYLKPRNQDPLLVESGWNDFSGLGGHPAIYHYIWSYNPRKQQFALIWTDILDGLEAMRFMSDGPLAGDIIVTHDNPTGHWPWPWGISVYKYESPGKLANILNFNGKAEQAGNTPGPNEVIDIDMPDIVRRLHLQH